MRSISLLLATALAFSSGVAFAQGGFAGGFADPNSINTLAGGGAAPAGGFATGRAQGAANTINQGGGAFGGGFAGQPGGAFPGMPGGAPGGNFSDPTGEFAGMTPGGGFAGQPGGAFPGQPGGAFPGMPGGAPGGFPGQPGQPQQQQQPMLQMPELATVIYGERVVCRATGQMLDDARELDVVAEFLNQYYDDGRSGLDARADDNIFTNATFRNDVISPEAHLLKTRMIRALEIAESYSPTEFYIIPVASNDLRSDFPRVLDLEQERDGKLRVWAERFLDDYRFDSGAVGEASWEFVPTFLPPPPRTPDLDLPVDFFPPSKAEELENEQDAQQNNAPGGRDGFPGAGGGFGGPMGGGGRSGYM